jgi:hypothetical protein
MGKKTGKTWNKGIRHKEESLQKMSRQQSGNGNGMFGKTHSAESRAKIAAAQTGRKHNPEHIEKSKSVLRKPVFCNENGNTYISAVAAANSLGITSQSVSQVALGRRKQCKGYTFKYL